MGTTFTDDFAPWRFGMLSLGPHFPASHFSGIVGTSLSFFRMTRDYVPINRAVGEEMFDVFPDDCKISPPVCDDAIDGDRVSPVDELVNPHETMNDFFLGNPDVEDDAMIGSVWKDSQDIRVFVLEEDPWPTALETIWPSQNVLLIILTILPRAFPNEWAL